jgi:hypothetical protein
MTDWEDSAVENSQDLALYRVIGIATDLTQRASGIDCRVDGIFPKWLYTYFGQESGSG